MNRLIDSNKSFIENPPVAGTEPGDNVEPVVSNEAAVEEQRHLEQEIRTQISFRFILIGILPSGIGSRNDGL